MFDLSHDQFEAILIMLAYLAGMPMGAAILYYFTITRPERKEREWLSTLPPPPPPYPAKHRMQPHEDLEAIMQAVAS